MLNHHPTQLPARRGNEIHEDFWCSWVFTRPAASNRPVTGVVDAPPSTIRENFPTGAFGVIILNIFTVCLTFSSVFPSELEPQFQFVISYEESIVIRKTIVLLIAGLLSLTTSLFAQRESDRNNRPASRVSLIQVTANPKDFDGQRLRLVGYLSQNGLDRAVGVFVSEVDGRT
jgi:hypothetical protein